MIYAIVSLCLPEKNPKSETHHGCCSSEQQVDAFVHQTQPALPALLHFVRLFKSVTQMQSIVPQNVALLFFFGCLRVSESPIRFRFRPTSVEWQWWGALKIYVSPR
jgi:hypothetical protein